MVMIGSNSGMPKYYIDHPSKDDYEIEIPPLVVNKIIKDYLIKTYYWSVAILAGMVGFLVGVAVK